MIKNKNNLIKVLHIGADNFGYGGRSVAAYNLASHMNRDIFRNDFLTFSNEIYENSEIKFGEIKLVKVENLSKIKFVYEIERAKLISKLLASEEYSVIHIHADHAYEALKTAVIAKTTGKHIVLIHAHNSGSPEKTGFIKKLVIYLSRLLLPLFNNKSIACSEKAGEYLFGKLKFNTKDIFILKNGIDYYKFLYNRNERLITRRNLELGLFEFVVGSVARLTSEKNLFFLLNVFIEIKKKVPFSRLIIVGNGPLYSELVEYSIKNNILNDVSFLGNRSDVYNLLQAMDVFILPSIYEGFGIVTLEAQVAGLPCIVSENIPESAGFSDLLIRLPLEKGSNYWADYILNNHLTYDRKNMKDEFLKSGFDIEISSKILEDIYLEMIKIDT
jgi:glycosyltransferase involved in cell wall biosynthesis